MSTKLDTKHPWVMGIQVSSNERPFLRGDNYEIAKKYIEFKNSFLEPMGQFQPHFGKKYPWVKRI